MNLPPFLRHLSDRRALSVRPDATYLLATDGSCMASTSCVNPSLTYMALTARAVDHAVSEMKKGAF